jgi:hypothetical protein
MMETVFTGLDIGSAPGLDVPPRNGTRDDTKAPLFSNLDEARLQIGVEAGAASLLELANLINAQVADFKSVLNGD